MDRIDHQPANADQHRGLSPLSPSMVAKVASTVASKSNLEDVAGAIVSSLREMGATAAHVLILDTTQTKLVLTAQSGLSADITERLSCVSLNAPLLATRAARERTLQVYNRAIMPESSLTLANEVLDYSHSTSLISVPLIAFETLVGVLTWGRPESVDIDEDSATAIRSVAEVFALGIVNARNVVSLRESNQRFDHIINSSAVGMSLVGLDGHFIRPNEALCEMVGYSADELTKLRFQDITHPDDLEKDLALAGQLQRGEIPRYAMSKRYIRKDGRVIDIVLHGSAVREGDRVIYFIAQVVDVTEANRQRDKLEQSEARFRLLAENARDLIYRYRIGPNPGFDFVSPSAERITGYTAEEHYADPMLGMKLIHPDDRHLLEAVMDQPAFDGKPLILRFVRKDGRQIWVEQLNTPVFDEGGKIIAVEGIARDITERKIADLKVRESEERLRFVVGHSRDAIFIQDKDLRYIWVANAFPGFEIDEFLGKTEFEMLPMDQAARLAQMKRRVMETGEDVQSVSRVTYKGRELYLDVSYSPWRDHEGKIIGVAGFVRDITESKKTEDALRESEESLRLAQRVARIGSWDWDLASGKVTWTEEVYRIFGLPIGKSVSYEEFLSSVYSDDRAGLESAIREALSRGERYNVEHRILLPDGKVRLVREDAEILGPKGEPKRVVGTVQDVTELHALEEERKRLVDELDAEKRWFETVVRRSPIGILLVHQDGVVHCNERAQALFGRDTAKLSLNVIANQLVTMNGKAPQPGRSPAERVLAGRRIDSEEYLVKCQDGKTVPILLSAAPILDDDSSVIGGVVVLEDITEMKENQRTREEWIGIIVHDLRQPLATMMAQAELLDLQCREKGDFAPRFARILDSLRRMNEMVTELLDATVIEANRLNLRAFRRDLRPLTEEILEKAEWLRRGIDFVHGEEPVLAYVDSQRYEQVLLNLLSNAIKYGGKDAPIRLELEKKGANAVISVTNEGEGIAPERIRFLFERFHRTPEGRTKATGHGLGLYIVKGLVEAHGGHVWAESESGTTTFAFSLPTAAAH